MGAVPIWADMETAMLVHIILAIFVFGLNRRCMLPFITRMLATAKADIWKLMSQIDNGLMNSIVQRVNAKMFRDIFLLHIRPTMEYSVIIVAALMMLTGIPAINTYVQMIAAVIAWNKAFLCLFFPANNESRLKMMPRCNPDKASMCEAPAIEKLSFMSFVSCVLSPKVMADIVAMPLSKLSPVAFCGRMCFFMNLSAILCKLIAVSCHVGMLLVATFSKCQQSYGTNVCETYP